MSSEIRDINLAESGERKIEWVKRNCDLLRTLEKRIFREQAFCGQEGDAVRTSGGEDRLSLSGACGGRRGNVCDGL